MNVEILRDKGWLVVALNAEIMYQTVKRKIVPMQKNHAFIKVLTHGLFIADNMEEEYYGIRIKKKESLPNRNNNGMFGHHKGGNTFIKIAM